MDPIWAPSTAYRRIPRSKIVWPSCVGSIRLSVDLFVLLKLTSIRSATSAVISLMYTQESISSVTTRAGQIIAYRQRQPKIPRQDYRGRRPSTILSLSFGSQLDEAASQSAAPSIPLPLPSTTRPVIMVLNGLAVTLDFWIVSELLFFRLLTQCAVSSQIADLQPSRLQHDQWRYRVQKMRTLQRTQMPPARALAKNYQDDIFESVAGRSAVKVETSFPTGRRRRRGAGQDKKEAGGPRRRVARRSV